MAYTSYSTINSLDEIVFIAGTDYYITYIIKNTNSALLDLSGGTIEWNMSYYGQQDSIVVKTNGGGGIIATSEGLATVHLLSTDTTDLFGKFSHQLTITDPLGEVFSPAQGVITIVKKIQ